MNFTREPIIETVITPREGMKLLVRNSKGGGQEDYYVDAVEVISFGHSFFFRSLERPKSFLVPVSDYEVLELKEVRMLLKNIPSDRSIKIGGGKDGRSGREGSLEERDHSEAERVERAPERSLERPPERLMERKRDKRRRGRRGGGRHESVMPEARDSVPEESFPLDAGRPPSDVGAEEHKAPSFISKLFPPPPTLIKETLSRYKPAEVPEQEIFSRPEEKFDEDIFEVEAPKEPKENVDEETTFED